MHSQLRRRAANLRRIACASSRGSETRRCRCSKGPCSYPWIRLRAIGLAYSLQNDLAKGERLLRSLVEEDPCEDEAWLYLGTLLFQHSDTQAALEPLERHLSLRPENPGATIYWTRQRSSLRVRLGCRRTRPA